MGSSAFGVKAIFWAARDIMTSSHSCEQHIPNLAWQKVCVIQATTK